MRRRPGERPRAPEPGPASRQTPIDRRPEMLADASRRARLGAIELVAVAVVIVVLIAFLVWFFAFAHNPLLRP
jgi:hypothetical protein